MLLLNKLLRRLIRVGDLTVIDAYGRAHRHVGVPGPALRPVTIRLHDPALHTRLFLRSRLAFGEAWMDGTLTVEEGELYDMVALLARNLEVAADDPLVAIGDRAAYMLRRLQQFNPAHRSRRNVAHHYDLSDELYRLFLDGDWQYSCAYFAEPDASLEAAQAAKKRHIAAKLLLEPGQRVLDIGCGWGGLAITLARDYGVEVTGITLSSEQLEVARRRAVQAGVADRVQFVLRDYRHQHGRFDRIVSVGMFEHVGVNHYLAFFRKVHELLTEDGVALLHSIGRALGPGATNVWLRKYIFPGGYSPALSEVLPQVEKARLWVTDVEVLRLHYAETLREWRRRFQERRAEAERLYDERFCRMWEFYLAGCEAVFRHQDQMVFQLQLARDVATVPITRDYIYQAPAAVQRIERAVG